VALTFSEVRRLFQVPTRGRVRLSDYDPGWAGEKHFKNLTKTELEIRAEDFLHRNITELANAQQRLSVSDTHSVLIVLQASEVTEQDRAITHLMSVMSPPGFQIFSFKKPSSEALDQTFLRRYVNALPERGRIGAFTRSYYEDVLLVRVRPELIGRLPGADPNRDFWRGRYDDINAFERQLRRNGTLILKFFLNVSRKEQRRRFLERLERPEKTWKFSVDDLEERKYWSGYQDAFEQMVQHTSTTWAPWWVIPADNNWVTRALVVSIIARSIDRLGITLPHGGVVTGRNTRCVVPEFPCSVSLP
jgi:PPK2 family polyphosphate:nucleotide phosphotransferase